MLVKFAPSCSILAKNAYKSLCFVAFSVIALSACTDEKILSEPQQFCALPSSHKKDSSNDNQYEEKCSFITAYGKIELRSSNPSMPIEQPISMHLRVPIETHIVASEITGISMYMGRIPIVWEQLQNDLWRTDIYLGACTDPNMIWQLEIQLSNKQTHTPEHVQIQFQSTR